MREGVRKTVLVFCSVLLLAAFMATGCTRYANEEQLQTLDETKAAALSAEEKVTELEKQKAALQAKLAEKQDELKKVGEEKKTVQSKL